MLLNVYKPVGVTPLQVVQKVREKFLEYSEEKIGYAGRLDPMAHGVLLLMIGSETTKRREEWQGMDKTYQFSALLGVETDSYDLLGKVSKVSEVSKVSKEVIESWMQQKIGKWRQVYPGFSSKTVGGRQLFKWAREGRLGEIEIPSREVEIYDLRFLGEEEIGAQDLHLEIKKRMENLQGEFRQELILEKWDEFFKDSNQKSFKLLEFEVECSSGTYIRGLVKELGELLGTGAVTYEILRTRVGDSYLEESLKI